MSHQQQQQQGLGASPPQSTMIGSRSGVQKKRISKDEKICKLKSDLKVTLEENERLKKDMERFMKQDKVLHNGGGEADLSPHHHGEQEAKFRAAMRAMKKVTVSQEMCIRTLRTKAKERNRNIKQRDVYIDQLEQKIQSQDSTAKMIKKSKGDAELHAKLRQLQMDYDTIVKRNNNLEEILDEKEAKVESLQKQRNSLLPLQIQSNNRRKKKSNSRKGDSDTESGGSGSLQSISTAGDFDVARLKTELAQKTDKIIKLQMDLEMVKDELYDLKQKKNKRNDNEVGSFGGNSHFSSAKDPFGIGGGGGMQHSGDDWTDVDESESEFGEAPFGDCHVGRGGGSPFGEDSFFNSDARESDFW
jgi:chromosome segregation ATPase